MKLDKEKWEVIIKLDILDEIEKIIKSNLISPAYSNLLRSKGSEESLVNLKVYKELSKIPNILRSYERQMIKTIFGKEEENGNN